MAKHKCKCPECPAGERWAVPYADFLSLLLALFIALWAISESNPAKIEALKTEFIKIFDFTPTQTMEQDNQSQEKYKGAARVESDEVEALKQITLSQQETIKKLRAALDQTNNEDALNLPSRIQFERGSAQIVSQDVKDDLERIVQLALHLPPQVKIEIRGYTDNSDSILTSFDLAYARAENVMKYFIDGGFNVNNLRIKSYGPNSPINNDPGALENNRVEISFRINSGDESAQKSVLELIGQSRD